MVTTYDNYDDHYHHPHHTSTTKPFLQVSSVPTVLQYSSTVQLYILYIHTYIHTQIDTSDTLCNSPTHTPYTSALANITQPYSHSSFAQFVPILNVNGTTLLYSTQSICSTLQKLFPPVSIMINK